jgi:peptidoglycan-N-acetylglucosamine deacetylase
MSLHRHPPGWSPALLLRLSMGFHAGSLALVLASPDILPWVAGGLIGNQALLALIGLVPQSHWLGPNLSRLPEAAARRREVALTFDDGPDPSATPAVLDLLDRYDARASFFCVGERAAAHPDLVREIARRGHSIENHSQHHSNFFAAYGLGALGRDVAAAQQILTDLAGRPPRFFRAPMGLRSPLLDPVLAHAGLQLVSWTRRGYDAVSCSPERILRRLLRRLAPGDILLLHDRPSALARCREPVVLSVLPALLRHLVAENLRAVSLPSGLDGPVSKDA